VPVSLALDTPESRGCGLRRMDLARSLAGTSADSQATGVKTRVDADGFDLPCHGVAKSLPVALRST
jgi:hypothetical protein